MTKKAGEGRRKGRPMVADVSGEALIQATDEYPTVIESLEDEYLLECRAPLIEISKPIAAS